MKKEDLQTGMILEFENGDLGMVIRSVYGNHILLEKGYAKFSELRDSDSGIIPVMSIRKVRGTGTSYTDTCINNVILGVRGVNELCATEILWEREVYPKWFRSKIDGTLVKFTGLNEGIVVATGWGNYPVGYKCKVWEKHSDSKLWQEVQEPAKEMSIGEIEESLGFRIKIIKE